jgi:RNA polymerase sigma factor (sigma-70 family)
MWRLPLGGLIAVLDEIGGERAEAARLRYASPEALFRAEYRRLVRTLDVLAGSPDAAADAVQEAFARLVVRWDEVSRYEDQAGWVRRVAVNLLLNRRRSLLRRAAALARMEPPPEFRPPEAGLLDLRSALDRLPQRQRVAVVLFYLADLSVKEVAAAMGVSEGSVNKHLHRGRETLRRLLEEDQDARR